MRLVKILSIAIVTSIAATALVSASSATASENTSLCKVNETPCAKENRPASVHLVAATVTFKIGMTTVLCLSSLVQATPEGIGLATAPSALGLNVTQWIWNNCGTNAAHDNCELKNERLPLLDALRTAANLGTIKMLFVEFLINCSGLHCVFGGKEISKFPLEGAGHQAGTGKGMFTATEVFLPLVSGFLCAEDALFTALYEPLENLYVST